MRLTLAPLAARVRRLIGDTAYEELEDEDIAQALDARRRDIRYLELEPADTIAPGGAVSHLEYHAPFGEWEGGVQLVDGSFNVLSPASSDLQAGVWTFAAHQPAPVYATGRAYDVHAAAADLLEQYAAQAKCEFDFTTSGGDSYRRSQKAEAALALAERLRMRQRPQTVRMVRTDV